MCVRKGNGFQYCGKGIVLLILSKPHSLPPAVACRRIASAAVGLRLRFSEDAVDGLFFRLTWY